MIAIAAMAKVVVNTLAESSWGTFTIGVTIPIALLMSLYMYRIRKGRITEASIIGVVLLLAGVWGGEYVAGSPIGSWFLLSEHKLTIAIMVYGFCASVLPVWLLLCPRDYLSSYLKIGTIAFLILGIMIVNPELKMPAISQFTDGGPVVPGKLWPFVFITIACGAISGFHGLVGSGTTPKMVDKETQARMIGYGAMLIEGIVGVVALIAAASLSPGDYFAINSPPDKFAALGLSMDHLPEWSAQVHEKLAGRTGGAVSLAIGMSQIFSGLPGLKTIIKWWYHFALMFEALFVLTTVDTGTRVARFMVQEFGGRFHKKLGQTDWMPGALLSTALVCFCWGWLVWTGSINTIWPMLGICNQLLACIALCAATTMIVNSGKSRYAWITLTPLLFVATATETAGYQLVKNTFIPKMIQNGKSPFQGWLLSIVCVAAMLALVAIFIDAFMKWTRNWRAEQVPA
jgi:carbon starvation protein